MTVGWLKCYTGHTAVVELSQEIPVAEPYKYLPWLRHRNEDTPAAAAESARVQPSTCSQQVMLATREIPLQPLLFRKRRKRRNSRCSLSFFINGWLQPLQPPNRRGSNP
jgi:hypothetical protein